MNRSLRIAAVCAFVVSTAATLVHAQGRFIGTVVARWIVHDGADIDMELVEPFEYVDPRGRQWPVKAGAKINGASIPQPLWTFGSPYTGDYRRAAVVHDYYCDIKTATWQDTHRMFLEAMIDGGLSKTTAQVMFSGVWWGGPRWEIARTRSADGKETVTVQNVDVEEPNELDMQELRQWIEQTNPSREQIEHEVERRRKR